MWRLYFGTHRTHRTAVILDFDTRHVSRSPVTTNSPELFEVGMKRNESAQKLENDEVETNSMWIKLLEPNAIKIQSKHLQMNCG